MANHVGPPTPGYAFDEPIADPRRWLVVTIRLGKVGASQDLSFLNFPVSSSSPIFLVQCTLLAHLTHEYVIDCIESQVATAFPQAIAECRPTLQ